VCILQETSGSSTILNNPKKYIIIIFVPPHCGDFAVVMYSMHVILLLYTCTMYGYYLHMRELIFIRVVIGYALESLLTCQSSAVVKPVRSFPLSFRTGSAML